MVSIVAGAGAGLVNTSREVVGAGGELGRASTGRALEQVIYWDNAALVQDRQTYWYAYDALNRFTITKGRLSSTSADASDKNRFATAKRGTSLTDTSVKVETGTDGTLIGYDKLSRRTTAEYTYGGKLIKEVYGYSSDGYLQTTVQNGTLSVVRGLDAYGRTTRYKDVVNNQETSSYYDNDGRIVQQFAYYLNPSEYSKNARIEYTYYDNPLDTTSSRNGKGALAKTEAFTSWSGESLNTTTTYQYEYWDGTVQKSITKTAPSVGTGTTTLTYDANGHVLSKNDAIAQVNNTYLTTASGLVLKRERNGTSRHYFYYADDNRVGDVGDTPDDIQRVSYAEQLANKTAEKRRTYYRTSDSGAGRATADFDGNYEPINDNYPDNAESAYTVRSNSETLYSVAQLLWGDRSMWYLLAESNGLRADSVLKAGQILVVPNKVTNLHNTAWTWRPYNVGEAIGAVDPTLPGQDSGSIDDGGNPANDGYGGDRSEDYNFISAWESYHNALSDWASGGSRSGSSVGASTPPTSPNNATYGRGLDAYMQAGRLATPTLNVDVRGANASLGWPSSRRQGIGPASDWDHRNGSDVESDQVMLGLGWLNGGPLPWGARGGRLGVFEATLGNAIGGSIASPSGVDWSRAPDQSDAETARLNRYEAQARGSEAQSFIAGGSGLRISQAQLDAWGPQARFSDVSLPTDYSLDTDGVRFSGGPRSVTAANGDSWARIARQQYGDERFALALARANGANSSLLRQGQDVLLPDLSGANLKAGGAFIAADAAQRARDAYSFSDGRDVRDIRLSFGYQSRVSRELSDLAATRSSSLVLGTGQISADPGYFTSLGNVLTSALPLSDKLSMAWDTSKYYFRNSNGMQGAVQSIGGVLEVGGAGALTSTGLGTALAVPLAFHGGDNIGTGWRRMSADGDGQTVTYSSLYALTGSRSFASAVDQGIPFLAGVAGAGQLVNGLGLEFRSVVDPNQLRYTQATVGYRSGSGFTIDDTLAYARTGGELPRVDVVRWGNGDLASIDNRRVFVGRQVAGDYEGYGLRVNVRDFDELLTPAEVDRFTLRAKDVGMLAKRGFTDFNPVPQTWGDAAWLRILNQETRSAGRGFSTNNPTGSWLDPKITGRL